MKDLIRICIHAFIIILFVSSIIGVSSTQYYNGPSSSQPDALSLTPGENEWITSHPVIKICPDPYYPPFELLTEEGGYVGISSEILKKISERAGLSLEVVPCENWSLCIEKIRNRDIDILGAIYVSDLRSDYLAYSDPFYTSPLVIITKNTAPQDLTMEDLSGKTVAVVDGYTSHLLLLNQYPSIHPVVVSNVPSGLEKVVFGSADAYLGDLATAAYHVEKSGFSNLQTSGTVYLPELKLHDLAFGIRNDQPELISIINKGLDSISDTEMNEVYSRWIPASLTQPFISRQIFIGILVVIAIFLLILSGFFLWNRILKRAVTEKTRQLVDELEQRKIIQEELRIKNDELYTAYEQLSTAESELKLQYQQAVKRQQEIEQQERILRQIRFSIDQSHDMMIWLDPRGFIRDVSESVISILGFSRIDLRSKHMSDIDSKFVLDSDENLFNRAHMGPIRFETEFASKTGNPVSVEVALIAYEYCDEIMFLLSARDIRERKQMEELKRKAFTQIDKNVEQFAILNDQIRNPLTLLMIYAEEMESPDSEKILEQISRIDNLVDKLDKGLLESEKVQAFLRKYYSYENKG